MEPWRDVDVKNGGMEAQMEAGRSVGQKLQIRITLMRSRIRIRALK
jgi:hypothetical protein